VVEALSLAGLAPRAPVPCGPLHGSGDGTYHVVDHDRSAVRVSTLGRFVAGDDDDGPARAALETAGFRWIDRDLGNVRVDGLHVYHFGDRGPRDVETLLFYWQD
jgi:hypothetical protein